MQTPREVLFHCFPAVLHLPFVVEKIKGMNGKATIFQHMVVYEMVQDIILKCQANSVAAIFKNK